MSAQDFVRIRFPSGSTEITYAEAPKVGDRLTRGEDEWEVIAVEEGPDGTSTVTLGPPGNGKIPPRQAEHPDGCNELLHQSEVLREVSRTLRRHSDTLRRDNGN